MSFTGLFLESNEQAKFHENVWQSNMRLFRGGHDRIPEAYKVSISDVDDLFWSIDFPLSNFNMADGQTPLPVVAYANGGGVNRDKVMELHKKGATIILRSAERWSMKLRKLCAVLQAEFCYPVQANIYMTPAGRTSTPPHWDNHDLFIAQISGQKRWRIFENSYALPLDSQRFDAKLYPIGAVQDEPVIEAGDIMYLPRGVVHEPLAEAYSVHISFGVLVTRWSDLLKDLIEFMSTKEIGLREAPRLPSKVCEDVDIKMLAQKLGQLAKALTSPENCDEIIRSHVERLVSSHKICREGNVENAFRPENLSAESAVRKNTSIYAMVEETGSDLNVFWQGGQFKVPNNWRHIVDQLLSGRKFELAKLSNTDQQTEVLAFFQLLMEQGFIEWAIDFEC